MIHRVQIRRTPIFCNLTYKFIHSFWIFYLCCDLCTQFVCMWTYSVYTMIYWLNNIGQNFSLRTWKWRFYKQYCLIEFHWILYCRGIQPHDTDYVPNLTCSFNAVQYCLLSSPLASEKGITFIHAMFFNFYRLSFLYSVFFSALKLNLRANIYLYIILL